MSQTRLDVRAVALGLVESREKAQRLILAGMVEVNGRVETKPSYSIADSAIVVLKQPERFVSRGGDKLEGAFHHFGFDVTGSICLDAGASTGGFTDCMLQHGAAKVYAIDVGKGQLHWKLRNDPRVTIMDEINVRYLTPDVLSEAPRFAAVDVAFISLTKVLPAIVRALTVDGHLVSLIKPQFEAGREQVGKGGVVRDASVHAAVIENIRAFGTGELHLSWQGVCPSPIKGPAGNTEFLAYWKKSGT